MRREIPLHRRREAERTESHAAERLMAGSPPGLPALFSRARGAVLGTLAVAALAFGGAALAAATAEAEGYRLAGIMATGADHIGFLAVPGGGQMLIRQGSALPGGAKVLAIADKSLTLALPDGRRLVLELSGSGAPAGSRPADGAGSAAPPAAAPATVQRGTAPESIVSRQQDRGTAHVRRVAASRVDAALKPRIAAERAKAKAGDRDSAMDAEALAVTFQGLFAVREGSALVAVNGQQVKSAAEAMESVRGNLSKGVVTTLNFKGPYGPERVYLLPERPAGSTGTGS